MAYNENKTKYNMQYAKENLKRIPLDVQKEKYEEIKIAAHVAGEKVNSYIKTAIDERMERDKTNEVTTTTMDTTTNNTTPIQTTSNNEPISVPNPSNLDNDSDFFERYGFTKEEFQKSNEDAKQWKANQEQKQKKT